MTSKAKDGSQSCSDRGGDLAPKGIRTGTIKKLLAEINQECTPVSGTEVDLKRLGTTLNFIGQFTGREYTSVTEPLPLSFLKTTKLLYLKNEESGIQLFQYIKAPHLGSKSTMEFRIDGVAPRNEYRVKVVSELLDQLSTNIDDRRLRQIETYLLTESQLLECIDKENREILAPIHDLHSRDDAAMVRALNHLTKFIHRLPVDRRPSTAPLDEVVYTYLRTLPFLHFVGEYKDIQSTGKLSGANDPVPSELDAFCIKLRATLDADTHPYMPVTSIEEFPAFFKAHASDFIKLISAATGLPTQRRDLLDKLDYARKVLHMYVFHQTGRMPLCARVLSVCDCIAALCTIRHQQDVKTKYNPYWHGQENTDIRTRLFSQLEKERSIEELYESDYIPHGISQLLYSRFCQFHAQLSGQQDRYEAFQNFQIARLDKYAECLLSSNIDHIQAAVRRLNYLCEQHAQFLAHTALPASFIKKLNSWLNRNSD